MDFSRSIIRVDLSKSIIRVHPIVVLVSWGGEQKAQQPGTDRQPRFPYYAQLRATKCDRESSAGIHFGDQDPSSPDEPDEEDYKEMAY